MRIELLEGKLPLPSRDVFISNVGIEVTTILERMWKSLWHNYCANLGSTSTIYWMELLGPENTKLYLSAIASLKRANWIELDTRDNFSSISISTPKLLEFVTQNELDSIRLTKRFYKYLPYADLSSQKGKATVKANKETTNRSLIRHGMELGAKSTFSFDRQALVNNFDTIREEARKGIDKTLLEHPQIANDHANYGEVLDEILLHLAEEDIVCNMGINNVDSRGRAIKSNLDKVMNPIGFKVARALLVIPE